MLILSDSGVLTATTQLFLLNSIARRQRAAPSWAAAGERLFTTRASISVSYALLARLKPRWYHLRPSRLHRIYYHVERWRPNTIARQLNVHHGTVARVLARAGLPRLGRPRPSHVDPYLPFILATLEKFPTLTASRLHAMVRERGYRGGPDHFRHVIGCHRPRPKAEAYLRSAHLGR